MNIPNNYNNKMDEDMKLQEYNFLNIYETGRKIKEILRDSTDLPAFVTFTVSLT